MAEIMASPEYNAPNEGGKSPVFTQDAQGNLVRDTSYDTQPSAVMPNQIGIQAPSTRGVFQGPMGLGIPDELASYPSGMNNTPTEAGRLAQSITPAGNTVAYTPNEAARLASYAAPTRDTSAVAMSMPNQIGVGPRDTGDVARQTDDIFSTPAMDSGISTPTDDIFSTDAMSSVNDPGRRAGERRGERAAYQASLFEDDFETPDNQGANMDDDAPEASFDMSSREGRKAAADNEAQEQTGNPNATAVTDKDGNAVRSGRDNTVVTNVPPSSRGGGGGGSTGDPCVIATHAVANNGFSHDVKREAVRWCVKNLHKRWYGEAVRRGYRYHGIKAIEAGRAHNHYEEFKDYIDLATGKKRSLTNLGTFVYRTAQFFITGLFVK